jgi:hypothetical protein
MRQVEKTTDIPLRQAKPRQDLDRLARLGRGELLPIRGFDASCSRVGDNSLRFGHQAFPDGDIEGIRRNIQEQRDRVTSRRLDAVKSLRLAEHAGQLGDANRPPRSVSLRYRAVVRSQLSHQRLPSCSSNAFMIARAVTSLISRWRGIVIGLPSSAQTSWLAPSLILTPVQLVRLGGRADPHDQVAALHGR